MKKQTAGRNELGEFAPKFASLNDDILFGEIWSREDKLSLKIRSVVTISVFLGKGLIDSSLKYHIENAKNNGVSKEEMAEIITHAAFYAGWPNAWGAFRYAKEVYASTLNEENHGGLFGMGELNKTYAKYFIGNSYLKPLGKVGEVFIFNVTFEPGARNNWHIHKASKNGGQMLICVEGEGYYQEEGKEIRKLYLGDIVTIPSNVKHWHGASKDSWFSHLAIEIPGEDTSTVWLEPVYNGVYN